MMIKDKEFSKTIICWMFIIISCIATGIYISMGSVLSPASVRMPGKDSTVFIRGALGMIHGETLYVDFWDHKGPLLFLIQWVGLNMRPHSLMGIWMLEILSCALTMLAFYFTARLITNSSILSLIASFFSVQAMITFYELGNTVEEYALPFISFSVFFFIKYLKTREVNKLHIFLCGFFMACVFLINGNMFAPWIAFIFIIMFLLIREKKFAELKTMIVVFVAGFVVPLAISAVVMLVDGNLFSFLQIYFGFNAGYIKNYFDFGHYLFNIKIRFFEDRFFIAFQCFGVLVLLKERFIEKNAIDYRWSGYIYTALTLVMFNLSGLGFRHYALQLVPCMIVPAAICINEIGKWCKTKWMIALCLLVFVLGFYRFSVKYYFNRNVQYIKTYDTWEDRPYGKEESYLYINEWLDKKWTNELIDEWMK